MAATVPQPLSADLEAGLKRLKLRAVRQTAPEVLATAKSQRWAPEELLRTLVEAEIAARDAANFANRARAAAFPVTKTLDLTAAEAVERLYAGLADNSVGKTIDTLLRHQLIILDELGFAPLDPTGSQLLFRLVAAAYERRSIALASHHPFEEWGRFIPDHTTATALLDRLLHHAAVVTTDGESFRMKEAKARTTHTRRKTS